MTCYTVYKTTNLITGKIYIGMHQTDDPNDSYLGSGRVLRQAIRKYGRENFIKEVLFSFDNEQSMRDKEAELVTEEFCNRDDTYNVCDGGKGGFGYVNRAGLNDRTGTVWSDDARARMSVLKMGHVQSDETRRKLSENNGMKRPDARMKLSKSLTGRTLSEEHRQNLSNALRGKGCKGRKHSEETRRRMSEAHKRRHQKNAVLV